jgi:hypothetical protein
MAAAAITRPIFHHVDLPAVRADAKTEAFDLRVPNPKVGSGCRGGIDRTFD